MAEINWNALYTQFPGLQQALGGVQNQILQQGAPAAANTAWPEPTPAQIPAWRGLQHWRDRAQQWMGGRPQAAARAPYTPPPLPGYKAPTFDRPAPTMVGQTPFPRPAIDPALMAPGTSFPMNGVAGLRESLPSPADAERAAALRAVGPGMAQTPGRVGPEAGMQFAARPEMGVMAPAAAAATMADPMEIARQRRLMEMLRAQAGGVGQQWGRG